jgi:hypothetical protein
VAEIHHIAQAEQAMAALRKLQGHQEAFVDDRALDTYVAALSVASKAVASVLSDPLCSDLRYQAHHILYARLRAQHRAIFLARRTRADYWAVSAKNASADIALAGSINYSISAFLESLERPEQTQEDLRSVGVSLEPTARYSADTGDWA